MARFDISGASSRTPFAPKMVERNVTRNVIRKEIEPMVKDTPSEIKPMLEEEIMSSNNTNPLKMAALQTVDFESRKDNYGNPKIYELPSGDMGGRYEVAGINDRYHPEAYKRISSLPPERRAEAAAQYIVDYTAPLVSKLPQPIQPFAQDMAFNRGMGGATKYIQQGLNSLGVRVAVDGKLGPKTLSAINSVQPQALMRAASDAQLQDEYRKAQANPDRKSLLNGLENRIRNRLALLGSV
jgi:hypothetical protein